MATLNKIFTDKSPNLTIGATAIRFDKLFLRTGKIEELVFFIHWKYADLANGGRIVTRTTPFRPANYFDASLPPSALYVFRIDFDPPSLHIGENTGVEIVARSDNGNPFDLTLFFEFETPS